MMLMNGQLRVTIPKHREFVVKLFEEWDLVTGQLQLSDLDSTPSLHQGTQQTFWDMEATQPEDCRITFFCPVLRGWSSGAKVETLSFMYLPKLDPFGTIKRK